MASNLPLLVRSILIITLLFPIIVHGEGYIGEDLGTDLYKKIDAGQGVARKTLVGKRITGSNARINAAIKSKCFQWDETAKPFLTPGQEFTSEDLTLIESGIYSPIFSRINSSSASDPIAIGTDLLTCVQEVIKTDFARLKSEVAREQKTLSRIGNTAIYSDGSLENSSFDLMKDLEHIHNVIFSREVPYEGTPNLSAQSAKNFLSNPLAGIDPLRRDFVLTDRLSKDLADSGWKLVQEASWETTILPENTTSTGALCATQENTIQGLDAGLIADLATQSYLGTSTESQGEIGASSSSGYIASTGSTKFVTTRNPVKSKNNYHRGFRCSGFFCIDVDFVKYEATLLGGGKSYSIQSILEQNFKIVNTFAGSSFIQAKHTNNFFQLLLKNMDLPSMAHIGVVVTSLPAPILNLPGENTPRGKPAQSEAEKEYTELVSGVFADYGLDVRRSNSLSVIAKNEKDYGVTLLQELTTDATASKLRPGREFRSEYVTLKEAQIKNEYFDSFTENLNQFEAFSRAFVDHLGNFSSLVQKIDEIPQK